MPAAGWYEDSEEPGILRWWDGDRWTGDTRPLAATLGGIPPDLTNAGFPAWTPPTPSAGAPTAADRWPAPVPASPTTGPWTSSSHSLTPMPPPDSGPVLFPPPGSAPPPAYPPPSVAPGSPYAAYSPPDARGGAIGPSGWSSGAGSKRRRRQWALLAAAVVVIVAVAVPLFGLGSGGGNNGRDQAAGSSRATTTTIPPNDATTLPPAAQAYLGALPADHYTAQPATLLALGRFACSLLTTGKPFAYTWDVLIRESQPITDTTIQPLQNASLLEVAAANLCTSGPMDVALGTFQMNLATFLRLSRSEYHVTSPKAQEVSGTYAALVCHDFGLGHTPAQTFRDVLAYYVGPAGYDLTEDQAGGVATLGIRTFCPSYLGPWTAYLKQTYGPKPSSPKHKPTKHKKTVHRHPAHKAKSAKR